MRRKKSSYFSHPCGKKIIEKALFQLKSINELNFEPEQAEIEVKVNEGTSSKASLIHRPAGGS